MNKLAFVFPGQGSQLVGMGEDIFNNSERARQIFEVANTKLNYDLESLCFRGPEEELKLTQNTQPALLTTSVALFEAVKEKLPNPDFVAGHSLGEYSALVATGAISFEDAVYIVRRRGEFMNDAVPKGVGTMAAVMGADRALIETVCNEVSETGHVVQIANVNTDNQIVISGTKEGVAEAGVALKERGAKRIIELPVSGPFHSSLMKPASSKLRNILDEITIKDASIPVISNIDAKTRVNGDEIKESLITQIHSSVLWEDSVREMINQGVNTFIEIGSGKVLSGLIKKIDKEVKVYNIYDFKSLNEVSIEIGGQLV